MTKKIGVTVAGILTGAVWTTSALALGGYTGKVPEIDGPGATMAVALLVSLGIMIYRKINK